jgi:glycosyltransferase involved in cell wall biosynthesis
MKKLSVAIITLNEERNIGRCLDSVHGLADEIVVIDSFSTDKTEEICNSFNARFETHPFGGYIQQKQYVLDRCMHDYVLMLDADEAISDTLHKSIAAEKENGFPEMAYEMNRLTNYCGQWIYHCGWYPDIKLRLFDKTKAIIGGQNPHDRVIPLSNAQKTKHLKGDLLHYSYYSIEEHYKQADRFANIAAKALAEKGKKSSVIYAGIKATAKFVRNYIIKAGFLDGLNGYIICKISAKETWWKYYRVIEIQSAKDEKNR